MTSPLRNSPSGPVVTNSAGGPYTPGPGARLRLVEAQMTLGGTSGLIPTAPAVLGPAGVGVGGGQVLTLDNPLVNLRYRATVLCDVINPSTNVLGEVQLFLETSTDGVTYTEQVSNTHTVNSTEVAPAAPMSRQIRLDLPLSLGAGVGVTSSPQSTRLYIRAKVAASSGGQIVSVYSPITPGGDIKGVGTVLLQLEETL